MSVRLSEPDDGALVRAVYEAPPVPEQPTPAQGEEVIHLPRETEVKDLLDHEVATPVVTLTLEGGFNIYLHRVEHDWEAAEDYAVAINQFLHDAQYRFHEFLGLPESKHHVPTWLTRHTLINLQGIHSQVTISPLAKPSVGPEGGKKLVVAGLVPHGTGKRRH